MAWKQGPIWSREALNGELAPVARRLRFVVDILHTDMMMPIGLTESSITLCVL